MGWIAYWLVLATWNGATWLYGKGNAYSPFMFGFTVATALQLGIREVVRRMEARSK